MPGQIKEVAAMRKLLQATGIILVASALLLLMQKWLMPTAAPVAGANNTIYFYNWGDYIDPDILAQFEEETGYRVVYETFDSNEAMMTKVAQGGTPYDLIVPSEYTIEMMRDEGLLMPLDHSKIVGLENLDPRFMDQAFDPGNEYSIPYFWGTLGIIYDTRKYSPEDVAQWRNLWEPKFKNDILIYDGARESLGIGLLANGHSLNTKDDAILHKVARDLTGFMANVKGILADEIKMYLVQEEVGVGITFSGEAAMALEENENLAYHLPAEGSNIWFDNLAIPASAQNPEGAYALINYLLEPEIAAQNADYIWYSSPNQAAYDLIDPEAREDEMLYPDDEEIARLEAFQDLGQETTILYNDLFLELKLAP